MNTCFDGKLLDHIRHGHNDEAKSMLNPELARAHDDFGTLLHRSASYGNIAIARHLIDLGSDIDPLGQDGRTPLMLAVQRFFTQVECVEFFLEAGANVEIKNARGESVLQMVFGERYFTTDVVPLFRRKLRAEAGSIEDLVHRLKRSGCTMYHAVKFGDFDLMECMLKSGVDVNSRDAWNETPGLHVAIETGNLKLAEWLVAKGADVNARDKDGFCALILAAIAIDKISMELLLKAGADPNAKTNYSEETPLYTLADHQTDDAAVFECMELLLRYGAIPHNLTRLYEGSIVDAALESVDPNRADYLMSHLVLCEKKGMSVDLARCKIPENQAELTECYEECERALETDMFSKISLFDLLTVSVSKMRVHARNEAFIPEIQRVCAELELDDSYPYYYNSLMKRIDKAANAVKLGDIAIPIVCGLFNGDGNEYYIAARKVVEYLNVHELEELVKVSHSHANPNTLN